MSAGAGSVLVHVAVVALATSMGARLAREVTQAPPVSLVEIEAPPDVAPPEPEAPEPEPVKAVHVPTREPAPEPTAPAAAQAGQVLAANDDVVDFGDSFVVGKGANYAGGVTQANGTATHAVRDVQARGNGVPGGTGSAPALAVDRSRQPQLAGGSAWDCPFPEEADDAGLDHALVTLRVEVGADGRVLQANATREPGHGFGREARRCAMSKRWAPGLDREGNAAASATVVNVRFDR